MTIAIIDEVIRRICEESMAKIKKCLMLLSEEQINYFPNSHTNSITNLVLHLDGNVRQWILAGVCGLRDQRQRNKELSKENYQSKKELINILENLEADLKEILPSNIEVDLLEKKEVQCYKESKLSMLFHGTEHFSYHTGQIILLTKLYQDIDTGFYKDLDLTKTAK